MRNAQPETAQMSQLKSKDESNAKKGSKIRMKESMRFIIQLSVYSAHRSKHGFRPRSIVSLKVKYNQ